MSFREIVTKQLNKLMKSWEGDSYKIKNKIELID